MNFLKPPQGSLLNFVRYRKARSAREKLKIPEDKSNVIIGKWKPSIAFPKPGVSDKAVSALDLFSVRFDMLVEVISPCCFEGALVTTVVLSFMFCPHMHLQATFSSCFVITAQTRKSQTFMLVLNVCF